MNDDAPFGVGQGAYAVKPEGYFGNPLRELVDSLPSNPAAAILELGCGDGATGALALRQGKAGAYVGIELFGPMAAKAEAALTAVHAGDVETMHLPYDPQTFDVLICSEVLEHLKDPERVLDRLIRLLRVGGRVYASSPNVAHWKIVLGLLRGRFEYTDSGVMDRTHLRWFTPRSFASMFEERGIHIDRIGSLGAHKRLKNILWKFPLGQLTWSQVVIEGYRKI
jgi:SAM-dependent methyltransferase